MNTRSISIFKGNKEKFLFLKEELYKSIVIGVNNPEESIIEDDKQLFNRLSEFLQAYNNYNNNDPYNYRLYIIYTFMLKHKINNIYGITIDDIKKYIDFSEYKVSEVATIINFINSKEFKLFTSTQ